MNLNLDLSKVLTAIKAKDDLKKDNDKGDKKKKFDLSSLTELVLKRRFKSKK